ncbi:NYN domain-containing protein [Nocardioides glacieisoli]|uniref:NYN domain-containing protein n=2 Tax=Nocardioides glacieisoli TaxID=1168730 RepID=A0A4Q2RSQ0_9ACTN|nr:NYN domain-containing protein [Nocardioides glacieisoli]
MGDVRSALYLDFDNVFSGLLKLDPVVAFQFAETPAKWLDRLRNESAVARRWLVLRCYMNPSGSVPDPRTEGARVSFFRFRSAFTDAGFEVVDCPRLSHTKNGADIRLVIDAVEALGADAHYDEFVIASGDSDMTPLLVRLRAADRGVTLMSPSDSAVVMQAVADRLIGGDDLVELIDTRVDDLEASLEIDVAATSSDGKAPTELTEDDARALFAERMTQLYEDADEPLNLASLGGRLRNELGPVTTASRWFGSGGFLRAVRALDLPRMRIEGHYVWDESRHTRPSNGSAEAAVVHPANVPEVVARVTADLKLTALTPASWTRIHSFLAAYVSTHEFNLNEITKAARDQLADDGVRINRKAPALVVQGAAYGGCPLFRQPPPTANEIAHAFVENLLARAAAADIELAQGDDVVVREWFGSPASD